jgi:hypothetical protein
MSTHSPPSDIVIVPARDVPAALVTVPDRHDIQQQPQRLIDDFAWFLPKNRELAREYVVGLTIAQQWQFTAQIPLYLHELVKIVTTDIKDRVCTLVQDHLGFREFAYYDDESPPSLRTSRFSSTRIELDGQFYQWVFYPLLSYASFIPPYALKVMVYIEQAAIQPQAYWVADLVPLNTVQRRLDPVLCMQFHRWFVGIAAWQ